MRTLSFSELVNILSYFALYSCVIILVVRSIGGLP